MALVKAVNQAFEKIAPLALASSSWDNTGWLIKTQPSPNQTTCLLTIDLTKAVIDTIPENTGVIVSYHPPIFSGLKSLSTDVQLQSNIMTCIQRNIAVYSPHTSLDAAVGGINDFLASGLGKGTFSRIKAITGVEGHEGAGEGAILSLNDAIPVEELVARVKQHLGLKTVMLARGSAKPIQTIAICAGSGGSMLGKVEADAWLTGEASHHELLAATARGVSVILCNHSNTERPYLAHLQVTLQKALKELALTSNLEEARNWSVVVSQADRDPLEFV